MLEKSNRLILTLPDFKIIQKGTYKKNKGKYQDKFNELQKKLHELVNTDLHFSWTNDENKYWALFNGMCGIYYAFYNDGDNAEQSIKNYKVHGFNTVDEFSRKVVSPLKASSVLSYIDITNPLPRELEQAMNEAIRLTWDWTQENK